MNQQLFRGESKRAYPHFSYLSPIFRANQLPLTSIVIRHTRRPMSIGGQWRNGVGEPR